MFYIIFAVFDSDDSVSPNDPLEVINAEENVDLMEIDQMQDTIAVP